TTTAAPSAPSSGNSASCPSSRPQGRAASRARTSASSTRTPTATTARARSTRPTTSSPNATTSTSSAWGSSGGSTLRIGEGEKERAMKRLAILAAALPLAFAASCVDVSPQPVNYSPGNHVDDWRDEIIYQVLIDRFADADLSNDYRVDRTSAARYHGGD